MSSRTFRDGVGGKGQLSVAGWVLAIDFGTSYTMVAIAEGGRVELVDVDGVRAMPSGVWLDSAGVLVVGTAAERQARLAPERWERAPKKLLGEVAPLLLGGRRVAVVDAVAAVLRHAAGEAVRRQGGRPDEVRLTYPARWGERRRGALEAAAGLAGLGVPVMAVPPRLVPEPVAAALYFADRGQLPAGAQAAVYDLGGGTFDTAVLSADEAGYTVRALGGIDGVGGESFDALLYAHVGEQVAARDASVWQALSDPPDARWRRAGEDLYREVRRAKEDLSKYPSVTLDTESLVGVALQLTRNELESVLRPPIEATARELADTIGRAGRRPADLAAVYLAGGSSRIPLVERVVSDMLGVTARVLGEPKSVVAAGAARFTVGALVRVAVPGPAEPIPQRTPTRVPGPVDELPTRIIATGSLARAGVPSQAGPEPVRIPTYSQPDPWIGKPPPKPWWRSPAAVIGGVAVLLVVTLGLVIAINALGNGAGGGTGSGSRSSGPAAPPTTPPPSETADPSSPTAAEAALITKIGSWGQDCRPRRNGLPAGVGAALTCTAEAARGDGTGAVTPTAFTAYQFDDASSMVDDLKSHNGGLSQLALNCMLRGSRGVAEWAYGTSTTPQGACYAADTNDSRSVFAWYYDSSCVKLFANAGRSELAGLHRWWEQTHTSRLGTPTC